MSFYRFLVTVIKPLIIPFLYVTVRVITGSPRNYVEQSLRSAFIEIALRFLNVTDKIPVTSLVRR